MKVRKIISEVRQNINAVDLDKWFPSQYIHSKLKGFAALFIKREADDKRLFRYTDLWTTISCLQMEEQDLIKCCNIDIPNCKKVMVSKSPLPEMYSTRFGHLINISSVDYGKNYIITTAEQYKYTQNREFVDKRLRYAWINSDRRVVVPIAQSIQLGPAVITVKIMALNKSEAAMLDSCGPSKQKGCIMLLDEDFTAPEHLLEDIKNATTLSLLNGPKRLPQDELVNSNSQEMTNPTL